MPPVDASLTIDLAAALTLPAAAALGWSWRHRQGRRSASLRHLLELADRLETDLKTCRTGLRRAHAVLSPDPDLATASEQEAAQAVDAGLRSLLRQRIWIRDRAAAASQPELDRAAHSMRRARERLRPLLQALGQAQRDLDSAVREHIRREPGA